MSEASNLTAPAPRDAVRGTLGGHRAAALGGLAFTAVVGVLSYLVLQQLRSSGSSGGADLWWLGDFRDAIYYPAVAFLDGNNPYEPVAFQRIYPVRSLFPFYAPLTLLVYLPFAWLPFPIAGFVYFLLSAALTLLLAHLTLRMCGLSSAAAPVFGVATLIILSRPGYWNLLLGQCTLQVVIGTYVAIFFARERPQLAGLGLAVAMLKPTYGVPVAILMLAGRAYRAVTIGVLVAAIGSAVATAILVSHAGGVLAFAAPMRANYAATMDADPVANPVSSLIRIDTGALVFRLLGRMPSRPQELLLCLSVFGAGLIAVRWSSALRTAAAGPAAATRYLSAALVCLTVLTSSYHQTYDLLLMTFPVVALATGRWLPDPQRPALRWVLLALLALPAANHLLAHGVLDAIVTHPGWRLAIASLNGGALLAALLTCIALAHRLSRSAVPQA